jgi:hypothetical protein
MVVIVVQITDIGAFMRGMYPRIKRVVVEMHDAFADGIVHVLRRIGNDVGLIMIEPGRAGGDIGDGVMEIGLHDDSP